MHEEKTTTSPQPAWFGGVGEWEGVRRRREGRWGGIALAMEGRNQTVQAEGEMVWERGYISLMLPLGVEGFAGGGASQCLLSWWGYCSSASSRSLASDLMMASFRSTTLSNVWPMTSTSLCSSLAFAVCENKHNKPVVVQGLCSLWK